MSFHGRGAALTLRRTWCLSCRACNLCKRNRTLAEWLDDLLRAREQIGRLKVELEWLKKKLPRTREEALKWIDRGHEFLSVRRQCALLRRQGAGT